MAEAFSHDADPEPLHALSERLGIGSGSRRVLSGVEPVGAGDHLEEQRIVGDRGRHGPRVIEGQLDRHDAGVRDQTVRRLHAVDAAEGGGNADRAALITADGHVDLAGRDERAEPEEEPPAE